MSEPLRIGPRELATHGGGAPGTPPPSRQWHLDVIRAPEAWVHTIGTGCTVAVIDDSIDFTHPEFVNRVINPFNASTGGRDALAPGWAPHGTKVAGVILAGGREVCGVAPGALLLPVRVPSVLDPVPSDEEARGIRYAVDHGADVLCCAWGTAPGRLGRENILPSMAEAIRYAVTEGRGGRGCVVVFAAGNDGTPIHLDPFAAHPGVIAVGACNDEDRRPAYSNHGPELFCVFPSSDRTDLEPHKEITTTTPTGSLTVGETWYTDSFGRTSAACAGVAGVCALILGANPTLAGWQVREVLRESCVKIAPKDTIYDCEGHSDYYGYGRPDAADAVRLASSTVPTPAYPDRRARASGR